jgi:CRP-like cAMP-binding protein
MWALLFKNFSRYVSLTDEEKEIIQSLFHHRKYRKRQYILQEGDVSRYDNFIIKGLTRTYEVDDKGQEHVLQFGVEDWWVGDMYSFLTDTPSTCHIDCLEDTELLRISKPDEDILYQKVPKLERFFRILIQNAYIASMNRISSSLQNSAAERYQEFLKKYPRIGERVPNHQIASYLGLAPQSLSRIRSSSANKPGN